MILSLGGGRVYDRADDLGSPALLVKHLQASRASLQPVQSLKPTLSRLDRPFQASPPKHQAQEPPDSSSFGVLLRADELARTTDAEAVDKNGSL
jgi:hypothetical protein